MLMFIIAGKDGSQEPVDPDDNSRDPDYIQGKSDKEDDDDNEGDMDIQQGIIDVEDEQVTIAAGTKTKSETS